MDKGNLTSDKVAFKEYHTFTEESLVSNSLANDEVAEKSYNTLLNSNRSQISQFALTNSDRTCSIYNSIQNMSQLNLNSPATEVLACVDEADVQNQHKLSLNIMNEEMGDSHSLGNISLNNKLGGLVCILICVLSWVAMAEIIPLFEQSWNHSYFMRFVVNTGWSLMLIPWFLLRRNRVNNSENNVFRSWKFFKNICIFSIFLSFVATIGGYAWYLSLEKTSASLNTSIFQSSVTIAYVLSVIFLGLKITHQKNLGLFLSIFGLVMVSYGSDILERLFEHYRPESSNTAKTNTVIGVLLCFCATFGFAIEEVAFGYFSKKYFNSKTIAEDSLLVTGMTGIMVFLTLWPIFFLLDATGVEKFSFPPNKDAWFGVLVPMFLDSIYNGAFFGGIALTNPVFMGMGQLLMIPATYLCDLWIHGSPITISPIIGSVLIMCGFVLMELPVFDYICVKKSAAASTNSLLTDHNTSLQAQKVSIGRDELKKSVKSDAESIKHEFLAGRE